MRWIIIFLIYFSHVEGEEYNGVGYHKAIGIPKAFKLMVLEGQVSRIVGGSRVPSISAYPYQAGIVVSLANGLSSICGGALVSSSRVVTAAHCWWDGSVQARRLTVVLGSLKIFSGGTRISASSITINPYWNAKDAAYDIAIVRIVRVVFNNNIQPIQLPASSDVSQSFAGLSAITTGYGKTSESQSTIPTTTTLHQINLRIISNADCKRRLGIPLYTSHLCTSSTGGIGTCDGDSGGPLTVIWKRKRTLVGIVSFGMAAGCQSGYPSVYTRVSSFLTWIKTNL